MLSFQLIDSCLLQITINCQTDIGVALELNKISLTTSSASGSAALHTEKARSILGRPFGTKNMSHRTVHRIVAIDISAGITTIESERVFQFSAAVEQPTAQGGSR